VSKGKKADLAIRRWQKIIKNNYQKKRKQSNGQKYGIKLLFSFKIKLF
jgi:hypothetical protein